MELKYRPEIDGLRAIAVVAVLVYHSEIYIGKQQFLAGGFLGVDIFFVISGFLITSIIMSEFERSRKFSLINFYERRIRRLLPALLTVILVSLPFAWQLMLPAQLVDFSKSILSTLAFGSNFYWYATLQEYGAESALLKPFLHTWTLAVEEQFYIFYPVILLVIYKWYRKHAIVLLMTGLLLSLQFAEIATPHNPSFSFYMLPSRFWELLAGGVLANLLYLYPQKYNHPLLNRTMPVLGMYLIVHSIFFLDFDVDHPGFVTLLPVLGTVLVIWFSNKNDLVTTLLSSRIFVGVGLLSYSIYLWHYPIFAFGRFLDSTPTWHDKAHWIFITFVFSYITYKLVEKPFRNKQRIPRVTLAVILVVGLLVISSLMTYWIINKGSQPRLGYLGDVFKDSSRVWVTLNGKRCHAGRSGSLPFPVHESCVFENNPDGQYLVVIGDSHAGSLADRLKSFSEFNSLNFIQITNAGCSHIKGLQVQYQNGLCEQRSTAIQSFLQTYPKPIIVYSSRIPLMVEVERFDNLEGDREAKFKPVPPEFVEKQIPKTTKKIINALNEFKAISDILVIVYPVPEQGFHVKDKLFEIRPVISRQEELPTLSTSYKVFRDRVSRSYEILDKIKGENVKRVYPESIFCRAKSGRCLVMEGDKIYFHGDNHVSPLGAEMIVEEIANSLKLQMPDNP
ncbi:acyltransferase family protein [uncultured Porticoccus sp.]|uniref:acyltransferase family protein n=1 Tax=uncultured Porticoccus sp. TaxID=1256050 RepID=UPI0030D8FFD8|tara:strand:+ start:175 stop:2202 length:2028 start_codon:yes stop_codon:yes gene_type:complete